MQPAGKGDFVTGETGVWGFSALTVGLNAEFYQVMNRGDRREPIFQDDAERQRWVQTLDEACAKTAWCRRTSP